MRWTLHYLANSNRSSTHDASKLTFDEIQRLNILRTMASNERRLHGIGIDTTESIGSTNSHDIAVFVF